MVLKIQILLGLHEFGWPRDVQYICLLSISISGKPVLKNHWVQLIGWNLKLKFLYMSSQCDGHEGSCLWTQKFGVNLLHTPIQIRSRVVTRFQNFWSCSTRLSGSSPWSQHVATHGILWLYISIPWTPAGSQYVCQVQAIRHWPLVWNCCQFLKQIYAAVMFFQ
jgi:hypothetical protein